MKLIRILSLVLILSCLTGISAARAQNEVTAVQLSLFAPTQLFYQSYSVEGLRLDLIYGLNQNVRGVDLGLINESLGYAGGLELGLSNRVSKEFGGVQIGLFNEVKWEFSGVQIGVLANIDVRPARGVEASIFYNDAQEEIRGLQFGLVNHAASLYGVQIGLLNFNDDAKYKGFIPFINAAF